MDLLAQNHRQEQCVGKYKLERADIANATLGSYNAALVGRWATGVGTGLARRAAG